MALSSSSRTPLSPVGTGFHWNGTTSDLAQQYYQLSKANATADRLTLSTPTFPDAIQARLKAVNLTFDELPGLLQRALVWDSGFVLRADSELVRVRTLNGVSMANIAVSKSSFVATAGCTIQNCTQPGGATWYKSKECNGDQMISVARCVVDDIAVDDKVHLSMWSIGGNDSTVPEMRLLNHVWRDEYTDGGKDYSVAVIHTDTEEHEPAYGSCSVDGKSAPGLGSIAIACYMESQIKNTTLAGKMKAPSPSAIVTTWLQGFAASRPTALPSGPEGVNVPPVVASGFHWDGATSDLAQQYHQLSKAQVTVGRLPQSTSQLPTGIQERLLASRTVFEELPGHLQRALVWDSGFVIRPDGEIVAVRTFNGVSMANIAVSKSTFTDVARCTAMNCTQPDGAIWYKSEQCNGDQMVSVAQCAVDDIDIDDNVHLSMWTTGGNDSMVPEMRLLHHYWYDKYTDGGKNYSVAVIHTDTEAHEPAYDSCSVDGKSVPGFGSISIACYMQSQMNTTIASMMRPPVQSAIVNKWLQQYAKPPPPSRGFNTILLIPIIAGVVLLIGVLVCLLMRRKSKAKDQHRTARRLGVDPSLLLTSHHESASKRGVRSWSTDSERLTMHTDAGGRSTMSGKPSLHAIEEYDSGASSSVMKILLGDPHLATMQLAYDQIHFDERISKGAYGEVWVGYCNRQTVALKRLLRNKTQAFDDVATFTYEIQLSAALQHPNIVQFLGVAWNSLENLVMVMEFVPRGDLTQVLRTNGNELTWSNHKVAMARGLVSAVAYLHTQTPVVIHRDLKSRNVLLSEEFEPKLIDFGVSRRKKDHTMTAGVGTPFWTAPEVLEGLRYTEKSDIYSLGVLLTELDTGLLPYHNATSADGEKLQHFQILNLVMAGELRPSLSGMPPDFIRDAIVGCLQHDPEQRPTAQELIQKLNYGMDYTF